MDITILYICFLVLLVSNYFLLNKYFEDKKVMKLKDGLILNLLKKYNDELEFLNEEIKKLNKEIYNIKFKDYDDGK